MSHAPKMLFAVLAPATVALAGDAASVHFERLGSGLAYGVSGDGSTVVGEDSQGAFAWTLSGMTSLGEQAAIAANHDGSIITGDVSATGGNSAGRYLPSSGWTAFGALGASGCDSSLSSAYDISSDGSRCVGLGWDGCSASAFLWIDGEGLAAMPQQGTSSTRADTISGNGMVIGGWDQASNGSRRAAAWYEDAKSGEWNEVLDHGLAVFGAFAESNGSHLADRANRLGNLFASEQATGNERGCDGTHTG